MFHLRMPQIQRIIGGLLLLGVIGVALYYYLDRPAVKALAETRGREAAAKQALQVKRAQVESLRRGGAFHALISADQEGRLAAAGNRIFKDDEAPQFIESLHEMVTRRGGRQVRITQNRVTRAVITLNGERDAFVAHRLPLVVQFDGGYNGISELLFELKSLNRYLGVDSVEMNSPGDTAGVRARIALSIYYVEG